MVDSRFENLIEQLLDSRDRVRNENDLQGTLLRQMLTLATPATPGIPQTAANTADVAPKPIPVASVNAVANPGFKFGAGSLKEMLGVKPELVKIAKLALDLSTQDFIFYDGVRTLAEQKTNLAKGTTKTLVSKHLVQADGFGHAIDLVPYIDGAAKWDWKGCYRIACAVDEAATELGFAKHIRWGGAWDRVLSDFGGDANEYKKEVMAYQIRHEGKDFIDGPHYEWVN